MNTTQNTILITGGGSGIGLETARLLAREGNVVIITGRNEERLLKAAAGMDNVYPIACDITIADDVDSLVARLNREFPALNLLINNAGQAHAYTLSAGAGAFEKAGEEMLTNYLSVIRLTEKLLPLLHQQPDAGIVNITSIVSLIPSVQIPSYSASKAALRSYTHSLRISLAGSPIKVFEILPPLVNTEFSKDIGGSKGIHPSLVAADILAALANDTQETHTGQTAYIYQLSLSEPAEALRVVNGLV